MTWNCRLRAGEGVGTKSGVTQDKSNCALRSQIANGDGALMRVIAINCATRSNLWIARHHCKYVRVGFRDALVHYWRHLVRTPSADGRLHSATWCMP